MMEHYSPTSSLGIPIEVARKTQLLTIVSDGLGGFLTLAGDPGPSILAERSVTDCYSIVVGLATTRMGASISLNIRLRTGYTRSQIALHRVVDRPLGTQYARRSDRKRRQRIPRSAQGRCRRSQRTS